MNQVPPQMPVRKSKSYILVICMAVGSIVFSSLSSGFFLSFLAFGLMIASMIVGLSKFKQTKEWIVALTLATVSLGFCINMIFGGIHSRVESYSGGYVTDDFEDDYFNDFSGFFDEDDVDYFD